MQGVFKIYLVCIAVINNFTVIHIFKSKEEDMEPVFNASFTSTQQDSLHGRLLTCGHFNSSADDVG